MVVSRPPPQTLDAALRYLGIGDDEFGALCRPTLHRTQVWCYRRGRKTPRADTANSMLTALREHGVELTLTQLLTKPAPPRGIRRLRAS